MIEVSLDPHNAQYVFTKLAGDDGFAVEPHRQGFLSMNEPIKQTQRLLLEGKIHHGGHAALAWAVGNVAVVKDPAGNLKFDKKRSADKIDPAVALVQAVGGVVLRPERRSVYEDRGVVTL